MPIAFTVRSEVLFNEHSQRNVPALFGSRPVRPTYDRSVDLVSVSADGMDMLREESDTFELVGFQPRMNPRDCTCDNWAENCL